MVVNDQPHIWYEACPVCYGTYFDAGEFRDFKAETILDTVKDVFRKERK
jgi:Zn-finger nucleic acid-binding protein